VAGIALADREPVDPDAAPPPARPGLGLATERTRLAWTRTALAFCAVGGIILRTSVFPGLVVLATGPLIYVLGLLARPDASAGHSARRLRVITGIIIVVAVVALAVAVFGPGRK
jgi:uncharacterized membrane protein YidH (DUF202 family)